MRQLSLLFFAMSMAGGVLAQSNTIDSLRQKLSTAKQDTNRVQLLHNLGKQFVNTNKTDSALFVALEAISLSKKLDYKPGEIVGLLGTSYVFFLRGDFPEALIYSLEGMKIAEETKNFPLVIAAANQLALYYGEQKNYPEALTYLKKANALAVQANYKEGEVFSLDNIGAVYMLMGQLDSALLYIQQANHQAKQLSLPTFNQLLNMGHIHFQTGQNGLALEYFKSGIAALQEPWVKNVHLSEGYLGMAKTFEKMGNEDSARHYATRSFEVAKEARNLPRLLDASSYLISFYKIRHNADSAFHYSEEARAANDSLFSQQKTMQLQNITFAEKLRQRENEEAERLAREERENNLQYAAIAICLVGLLILFLLLSHSIIVKQNVIRFLGALSLLILFEFINLLIHPFVGGITHHSPVLMLLIMVCVAALLIPLHHRLEHWVTHRLIEKNKRIRLAAAKKTIEELEGNVNQAPAESSSGAQQQL